MITIALIITITCWANPFHIQVHVHKEHILGSATVTATHVGNSWEPDFHMSAGCDFEIFDFFNGDYVPYNGSPNNQCKARAESGSYWTQKIVPWTPGLTIITLYLDTSLPDDATQPMNE